MTVTQDVERLGVPRRLRTYRPSAASVLPVVVLVVAPLVLVGAHVLTYTRISPIDELVHIDYLLRPLDELPVRTGEQLREPAMREEACRGTDNGFTPPPCSDPELEPSEFEIAYNTAAIHPPTYYVLTSVAAGILRPLVGVDSVVTTARLLGGLWLVAGLLTTYGLGRRLGLDRWTLVAVLLLATAAPGVHYYASIVNPDAVSVLVGAVVLLAVHAWSRRTRGGWWLLLGAAWVAATFKAQNIVVIGCASLALALLHLQCALERRRYGAVPRKELARGLGGAVLLSASALLIVAGWTVTTSLLMVFDPGPLPVDFTVTSFPVQGLAATVGSFLPPLTGTRPLPALGPAGPLVIYLGSVLLAGGVVAGALFLGGVRRRAWSWSLLILGLLGPPAFVVATYVITHTYFPVPSRYGLSLLPAMVLVAASAVRGAVARAAVLLLGCGCFAVTLVSLLLRG